MRRDLLSICLDRKQFGADVTPPVFGGATGADTRKALQQIQVQQFCYCQQHMQPCSRVKRLGLTDLSDS